MPNSLGNHFQHDCEVCGQQFFVRQDRGGACPRCGAEYVCDVGYFTALTPEMCEVLRRHWDKAKAPTKHCGCGRKAVIHVRDHTKRSEWFVCEVCA